MSKKRYDYVIPPHPVKYGQSVKISDIELDEKAQRFLNHPRARVIADNMIEEALGSLILSERDGQRYVVDGLHRWTACKIRGFPTVVKAEIHSGLTQQEEAMLFLVKNRESSKPNALDEYKVGLTAELPQFVDTEKVLQAHGLQMGSSSANSIGAVAGVLRIMEDYGPDTLDRTLTVAAGAWGRTPETWDGMLLGGLGRFLGEHDTLVDDHELIKKIAKKGTAFHWRGMVSSRSSGGGTAQSGTGGRISACYALILEEWNKGRRTKKILP
jgi:hypothetical protein